jgi:hypothetical protein
MRCVEFTKRLCPVELCFDRGYGISLKPQYGDLFLYRLQESSRLRPGGQYKSQDNSTQHSQVSLEEEQVRRTEIRPTFYLEHAIREEATRG